MDVREIDGADPVLARRFWEINRDAEAAYRVHDFSVPWATAEISLRQVRPGFDRVLFAAFDGEEMVGTGSVGMPLLDNTHLAFMDVHVDPVHRRRGIGRALVEAAEKIARDRGRRVLMGEAYGVPGSKGFGQVFGEALGYTVALEDGMKVVDLFATEPTWDGLEAEIAGRSDGYSLVHWHDVVPEELIAGLCVLNEAFNDEAPSGDLELEAEVWDADRVRKREAENLSTGRHEISTAALGPDGAMVGLTEVIVNENAANRGWQSGTLVLPEHRGRALGLLMKVANQRRVRALYPDCRLLITGNAGVNVSMNAVNDKLGYELVETCVEMVKDL